MSTHAQLLDTVLDRIARAADACGRAPPALLAVSKRQPADAVLELARAWNALARSAGSPPLAGFGENYVQEGVAKRAAVDGAGMEASIGWHLIGHLQTNKARDAADAFDCVQSVDRMRIVEALGRYRSPDRAPLDVLVQVNIDDESSKAGCAPADVPALCNAIAEQPTLRLRGLMAIPAPHPDMEARRPAFARVRALFEQARCSHPRIDTLSMGMSDDLELAIAEGSTMVRIGTALFGARD